MELIKQYVYAVTRRLPEKQRADVARELTSDIETMVGERSKGKEATDKQVGEVLTELGDPDAFSRQYHEGKRYLIGPRYFDIYMTLMRTLLLIVVPVVVTITLIAGFFSGATLAAVITDALGTGLSVAFHIFFWVTVIVALVDRSGIEPVETKATGWTPSDLPEVPQGNRIARSDAINGIVWSAVAVMATLWQVPAIHDAVAPSVPLFFSEQMWPAWTLGILAISMLSLGVEIVRLGVGVWDRTTVLATTLVNLIVIVYFTALLLFVKPVVASGFTAELQKSAPDVDWQTIMANGVTIFAVSVIVFGLYEIASAWYKYKKQRKEIA